MRSLRSRVGNRYRRANRPAAAAGAVLLFLLVAVGEVAGNYTSMASDPVLAGQFACAVPLDAGIRRGDACVARGSGMPDPYSGEIATFSRTDSLGARAAFAARAQSDPERLRVEVLNVFPHDPNAFTQGLIVLDGILYETTGQRGASTLRLVDRASGAVGRSSALEGQFFGEGLAGVGDRLFYLTWQEGTAFIYDRDSFTRLDQRSYSGEGWGLCYDGSSLVMSNGSNVLTLRDPESFAPLQEVGVFLGGRPLNQLNELECVGDDVYANVWQTDSIVRIDKVSGQVKSVIDASGLLTAEERRRTDVLNGIAYDESSGTFLITGKNWPKMFEVRFVPAS